MADSYDLHRRRRRRDRFDYGKYTDDTSLSPAPTPSKPPVTILGLAKPTKSTITAHAVDTVPHVTSDAENAESVSHTGGAELSVDNVPSTEKLDKGSVVVLSSDSKARLTPVKTNEAEASVDVRSQIEESTHSVDEPPGVIMRKASTASTVGNIISGVLDQSAQTHLKLVPPVEKQTPTKIIDFNFQWTEYGHDLMLDQTDFLVVGAVGFQGCGKSTLLSLLAGNTNQDAYRNYIFCPQTKEAKEDCLYQTSGVEMFVTTERIILLDTQPLLSTSMMYGMLRYERKFPSEYTSLQNFIEIQSVQLLTFLLSVCNVIIVADDWFVDLNLLRIVQDAEMLKPSTPASTSAENPSAREEGLDFYPTVVFVHNKASREDFSPETYFSMQQVLLKMFSSSKLKIKSDITMNNNLLGEPIIQPLPGKESNEAADVNLLLIPTMEFYKSEPDFLETSLPEYRGYPSFNTILSFFRAQMLSAPRTSVNHTVLTEKNWYHFAARMWETVKKSSLIAEYNRLLSATS